jgi:hypothetical protein
MSIKDVRNIMAAAVEAKLGFKCWPKVPAVFNPPVACIRHNAGNWDTNLPRSTAIRRFELIVAIPETLSPEEAQDSLDTLIETDIVKDAVEKADYAGKANYARVIGYRDCGEPVLDVYIGVRFDIEVR